jgi:hypothetical protein
MNRTKEETKGVQIRFPLPVHEELMRRCKSERRSLNNEVVHILSVYFDIDAMLIKTRAEMGTATEGSGGKADA